MRRRELLNYIDDGDGRTEVNGYEAVDLGLPSGLLWATCYIGTNTENSYNASYTYHWGSGNKRSGEVGCDWLYNGTESVLVSSADTATQIMGGSWRMPTVAECRELYNNTNQEVYRQSYIKLTTKTNENKYIKFTFGGHEGPSCTNSTYSEGVYVWSSTNNSEYYAYGIVCNKTMLSVSASITKSFGCYVRGVVQI